MLLVEDEALVAMMIQECLTESGHSVVGPISRASDALQAAKEADYDAAILDINLGDGMAYPVADIVGARRAVRVRYRLRSRHHRRTLQPRADPAEADRATNAGELVSSGHSPDVATSRAARAGRRRSRGSGAAARAPSEPEQAPAHGVTASSTPIDGWPRRSRASSSWISGHDRDLDRPERPAARTCGSIQTSHVRTRPGTWAGDKARRRPKKSKP